MKSKYFQRTYAKIFSHTLSLTDLRFLCRLWRECSIEQGEIRSAKTTMDELVELDDALIKLKPRCLPKDEAAGLAFLRGIAYTKLGARSQSRRSNEFDHSEALCILDGATEVRAYDICAFNTSLETYVRYAPRSRCWISTAGCSSITRRRGSRAGSFPSTAAFPTSQTSNARCAWFPSTLR